MPAYTSTQASSPCSTAHTSTYSTAGAGGAAPVWAPGSSRVQPREQVETLQGTTGTIERKIQAMLYGAHTGAAAPAPAVEYVLVCAVEQGDEAWVEVYAGIDINPAALTLPAVPLDS